MPKKAGRSLPLTTPRRLIGDLLHFSRSVPTVPVQRRMNVADLVDVRTRATRRISWCAIFTKAFARAAVQAPELRRAYLAFPWVRLYEHPFSIATVTVERLYQGENAVFFAHLTAPENKTLITLDERLRQYKTEPIESLTLFRRALKIGRLPGWLRRPGWWYVLNAYGPWRSLVAGTFGVSVYSGLGAESLHPLSPLTCTLNYGVVQGDGSVSVRIVYDHRVMDGPTVARALALVEDVLHQDILAELRDGGAGRAA
ncbi:MAG TPA: hypothetical protein VMS17_30610 [Gemmataceae bacterium]|nr:hypothetical protein [Gemmataceae bacterium]